MSSMDELLQYIKGFEKVAVAFSGGVDSTFLAYVCHKALGDDAVAITVASPYIPQWELEEAKALAQEIGIRHEMIPLPIHESVLHNPSDRCYRCKKVVFSQIIERAQALGMNVVVDGSNYDDTKDYRPGMKALRELSVDSPLLKCEWTKEMIRQASEKAGLSTHDKPAYACLLTRIPYDTIIDPEELVRIEKSEVFMMELGFRAVRVRSHGDIARIEVDPQLRDKLFDTELLDRISETIKSYGYRYVCIEASGYAMGSLNKQIGK